MTDHSHDHGCSCGSAPADGVPEFDARLVPPVVRPGAIFGAIGALPVGVPLVLVAPHDPAGLLGNLKAQFPGLTSEYVSDAPGECKVLLTKV